MGRLFCFSQPNETSPRFILEFLVIPYYLWNHSVVHLSLCVPLPIIYGTTPWFIYHSGFLAIIYGTTPWFIYHSGFLAIIYGTTPWFVIILDFCTDYLWNRSAVRPISHRINHDLSVIQNLMENPRTGYIVNPGGISLIIGTH